MIPIENKMLLYCEGRIFITDNSKKMKENDERRQIVDSYLPFRIVEIKIILKGFYYNIHYIIIM